MPISTNIARNFTFAGKNITILILEENPLLKTIEALAFRQLFGLRYLSLKHNALTVPGASAGNFFQPFLELVRLPAIYQFGPTESGKRSFPHQEELSYLYLDDNELDFTEVGYDDSVETGLLKLRVLHLQGNPLQIIPKNAFSPIANCSLHFLNLGSGHLELIHKGATSGWLAVHLDHSFFKFTSSSS